ncbi:MAG: Holliday junction resolvase RuvX [Candidatus Cloacimonetes bacterium]|nr:Holliday junction resolvase RuvX [Candidatus Cloacimonadota bacterium]
MTSAFGRIMAVDYGEKRIGIALSDPMRIFAKPLLVIANQGEEEVLSSLQHLITQHQVSLILVGMPYAIDGSNTPKTEETQVFLEMLKHNVNIPVLFQDERYSTCDADAELKKLGYTWQEARKIKDAMAACIFLKDYLNN